MKGKEISAEDANESRALGHRLLCSSFRARPEAVPSVCFGGEDRRDLYIVTADNTEAPERKGTIFRTRVETPGVAASLARV